MSTGDENVRVAVRCRPLSKKELAEGSDVVFEKVGRQTARVRDAGTGQDVQFDFDFVYDDATAQQTVFEDVGVGALESALGGYNATVFAYGQTGSGKTWSMMGDPSSEADQGLIPRINRELFARLEQQNAAADGGTKRESLVLCSYFEIYVRTLARG